MSWLKIKDARRYAGGHDERVIRGWMKDGLRYSKLPSGRVLIEEAAIDEFLRRYEHQDHAVDRLVDEVLGELEGRES